TSPATTQLLRLNSMTATSVLFCSKATRDLLKSFRFMGRSIGAVENSDGTFVAPHSISPRERAGRGSPTAYAALLRSTTDISSYRAEVRALHVGVGHELRALALKRNPAVL